MITTTTTLRVPRQAMQAAEHLNTTLGLLNYADGDFAYGVEHLPYGAAQRALRLTLVTMFEATEHVGDPDHDIKVQDWATVVLDGCSGNGECVQFQITYILGWNVVLTEPGQDDVLIPAAG